MRIWITIATVLLVLPLIIVAQEPDLCPSSFSNVPFARHIRIETPWRYSHINLQCFFTVNTIPAGLWVGVFKKTFNLLSKGNESDVCRQSDSYLRISYSAKDIQDEYLCGYLTSPLIYAAYSDKEAFLQMKLYVKQGYQLSLQNLSLSFEAAHVVYSGENGIKEEQLQYGRIVSHSLYSKERYDSNITSSLTLTGLKLPTLLLIVFHRLNLTDDCTDYIKIVGVRRYSKDDYPFKICSAKYVADDRVLYTAIETNLTIHFVSRSEQPGFGFFLSYEVRSSSGCDPLEIPHSNMTFDPADDTTRTYRLQCDEGYSFNGTGWTHDRVICINTRWYRYSRCRDYCLWESHVERCIHRCNKNSGLESLHCVPIEETAGSGDDISTTHNGGETALPTCLIPNMLIVVGTCLLLISY